MRCVLKVTKGTSIYVLPKFRIFFNIRSAMCAVVRIGNVGEIGKWPRNRMYLFAQSRCVLVLFEQYGSQKIDPKSFSNIFPMHVSWKI